MLSALLCGHAAHAQAASDARRPLDVQSLPLSAIESSPARTYGGDAHDLFKVANALLSPRGELLVIQLGGTSVIRFALDGERRPDIGRSGKGPGEFQAASAIAVTPHDTLLVFDYMLRRISVFSPERGFFRSVSTETGAICCSPMGWYLQRLSVTDGRSGEVPRASMRVAHWSESTGRLPPDTVLFRYSPPRLVLDRETGPNGTFSFGATHILPFNPITAIALGARHVVSISDKAFAFDVWTPATSSTVTHRYAVPARPVAARDVQAVYDSIVERTAEKDKSRVRSALMQSGARAEYPAIDRLLLDRDSLVWVRIAPTHADTIQTWVSFDVTGQAITRLVLPRHAQLLSISAGLALLLEEDEDTGLQRILLHRVVLSPRRGR